MYQPSGIGTAFDDNTHSSAIRRYTRPFVIGPIRIGVDSWTNTVRPQPVADATASAAQQAAVGLSIGRRARALGLAGDESQDSADDGFKCLGEHGSASVILKLPNALLQLVDLVGRFL